MKFFRIALLFVSIAYLFAYLGFRFGSRHGLSQCYPYAVPYSQAQGQGGNQ